MAQKKNNVDHVELDKDTRILKHRKKEDGKKSHHGNDYGNHHHLAKPEKREHDYMYLHNLEKFTEDDSLIVDTDKEED